MEKIDDNLLELVIGGWFMTNTGTFALKYNNFLTLKKMDLN